MLFETFLNPREQPFAIGECQARFNCLGPSLLRLEIELADHRGILVGLFHLDLASVQEGMVHEVVEPCVNVMLRKGQKSRDELHLVLV